MILFSLKLGFERYNVAYFIKLSVLLPEMLLKWGNIAIFNDAGMQFFVKFVENMMKERSKRIEVNMLSKSYLNFIWNY